MPRYCKKPLNPRGYKIGIAVILILLLSNAVLIYLLLTERDNNKTERDNNKKLTVLLLESNTFFHNIHKSLHEKDYQTAFRQLNQAKRHSDLPSPQPTEAVETAGTTPPAAEPAKAAPALQMVAKAPRAADEVPQPLVFSEREEYIIVVEKETNLVYVYRSLQGKTTLFKQYPCILGANRSAKKKEGDFATPRGVYFILRYKPGSALPENYGHGAYVLNYPNLLDIRANKKGSGIWLHGHSPSQTIGAEIPDTRGCVVVSNDHLKEMGGFLKTNGVPVVIVDRLNYVKQDSQNQLAKEVRNFLEDWRKAWESIDTKKYMSFYSPKFVNYKGIGYNAFRQHKERIHRRKTFIRVKVEDLALLMPPEYDGKVVVARFLQRYNSNTFKSDSRKIFYLEKGKRGWQIIGESLY